MWLFREPSKGTKRQTLPSENIMILGIASTTAAAPSEAYIVHLFPSFLWPSLLPCRLYWFLTGYCSVYAH